MIQIPAIDQAPAQRSEAWHAQRLGRVTGSEVGKVVLEFTETSINAACRQILGISAVNAKVKASEEYIELRKMDPRKLFEMAKMEIPESMDRMNYRRRIVGERLTGQRADPDGFVTHDMKWGIVNEAKGKVIYQMAKRRMIEEAPFVPHLDLMAGASPDGLIVDTSEPEGMQEGVAEIKCLRTANHLYKCILTQTVPADYMAQVTMEMWVTGAKWCDFIAHDSRLPKGLQTLIVRVYWDEDREKSLVNEIVQFLDEVDRDEAEFRRLAGMVGQYV